MNKPDNFKSKYQKRHKGKHIQSQKDTVSLNYALGGGLSGAVSGAATGAEIGSLFGPGPGTAIGLGIGALAGGAMGWINDDKDKKLIKQQELDAKNAEYIQPTYNPYTPTMSFGAYGGYMQPNAEIEDDEVVQVPNGTEAYAMGGGNLNQTSQDTYTANGATHAQGGIDTELPDQAKIFSDKIKHPELKKTYAELAQKLTSKKGRLEKIIEDKKATKIAKTTANANMSVIKEKIDGLFDHQEQYKASKMNLGIQQLSKKYGGYQDNSSITGNPGMNNVEYKEGGKHWIQKAVKGMRKDKPCTGSKFGGPTCPAGSKRYNLAKTFRKMNHEYGGVQQMANGGLLGIPQPGYQLRDNTWQSVPFACGGKYPWGGTTPSSTGWDLGYQAPDFSTNNPYFIKGMNNDWRNGIYMPEEQGFPKGTSFGQPAGTVFNTPAPSKLDMGLGFKSADNSNWTGNTPSPYLNQFSPYANPEFSGPTSVPETATTPATGNKTNWNNIAYGIAAYAPTIYNTAKGLFDKPYQFKPSRYMSTGYEKYKPDSVQPALNVITGQENVAARNIASKAPSAGQYMANRVGLAGSAMTASANAIQKNQATNNLGERAANRYNTTIDAANKSKLYTIDTANLENRAERPKYLGKAVEGVSVIAQMNKYQDNLKYVDQIKLGTLKDIIPSYSVDPVLSHFVSTGDMTQAEMDNAIKNGWFIYNGKKYQLETK